MEICLLAGASTIHTVRWANAMAERGHEVHLITMHPSKMDRIDERVHVYKLKIPAPIGYYANVFELKSLLRSIDPDVLHVHYASGYGTLARLVNYNKTLLSVWGSDVYLFPYESKRNEKTLRKNLASVKRITATGYALKRQTEKFVVPTIPIDIIPFGIDLDLFKRKTVELNDDIIIGTVKRLKPVYGIDILFKAVAKLIEILRATGNQALADRIKLLIVGDGQQLKELQELAKELNIGERITFTGAVPNEQVPDYINKLDVYCAFSRSESFGVAILEASACEVPVVVSDVGGLPEVVRNGETGYIIKLDNLQEMANKLLCLVINKEKRSEFGRNGREFVQDHYEWKQNVIEMESVYREMKK